jgi:hypothetical protein
VDAAVPSGPNVPSPSQSNAYVNVSVPGSVCEAPIVAEPPSWMGPEFVADAVGATFATATAPDAEPVAPSESVTMTLTGYESSPSSSA